MRSASALLPFSFGIVLLLLTRPSLPSTSAAVRLFSDLAVQGVILFAAPAAWLKWVRNERLADAGLTFADPRQWLGWLLALAAAALPLALGLTRVPSIHQAYPVLSQARTEPWLLIPSTFVFAVFGFAWEFFFRGFLLMGIKRLWGGWAIVVQAVPCALMHIGKPGLEVLASFPAALVFGAPAYRTHSIVPGLVLHWLVALVVNLGCVFWPLSV